MRIKKKFKNVKNEVLKVSGYDRCNFDGKTCTYMYYTTVVEEVQCGLQSRLSTTTS